MGCHEHHEELLGLCLPWKQLKALNTPADACSSCAAEVVLALLRPAGKMQIAMLLLLTVSSSSLTKLIKHLCLYAEDFLELSWH